MTAVMKSEIVIDGTALRAPSGVRGIGRYLRDLLTGLATIADTEAPELSFRVATHIDSRGLRLTGDLRAAADESVAEAGRGQKNLIARRRLLLGPLAAQARADLLHVAEMQGTPFLRPVPLLVTCYDLIPLRYPQHYLGKALTSARYPTKSPGYALRYLQDLRRYKVARRVVCISERTRRDVLALLKLPADRVDVVQTGIDLSRYTSLAPAPPVRTERPFALYVGHSDWRKNAAGMFDAIRIANRTSPLELRWAGGLRPADLAKMKALAAERGATSYVRFLGFVDDKDLGPLYRDAVALLFLSRLEGFGLPVVEAMAAGCPAIVAQDSAADEVAGEAGYIVSADDPGAAANRLLQLTAHPEERAERARLGMERAKRYNAVEMARGYLQSYRRALRLPTG